MFALARFAVRIGQFYVGFSLAAGGAMLVLIGLMGGTGGILTALFGAGLVWAAWRIVNAMDRVAEALKEADRG